jgi:threonine dehydratase
MRGQVLTKDYRPMTTLQNADLLLARRRISGYLRPTPLEPAPALGANTWLKLECANRTRSFKCRGALNAMLALDPAARAKGILAASSGNHAQGVALAAHLVGAEATILMPAHTPRRKVDGVRAWGAEALLLGDTYDEAEAAARQMERTTGKSFISAYNDPQVIAGAGTVGLEILDDLTGIQRVIVPVSGGGLISGIGLAMKAANPSIEVIGACSVSTPALYNWIHGASHPQVWETLAEALSGEIESGSITLAISQQVVDRVVLVTEDAIAGAIRWLALEAGWIAEGGGAVGVAALRSGLIPADDKRTVVVVSGGNIDGETLQKVLASNG